MYLNPSLLFEELTESYSNIILKNGNSDKSEYLHLPLLYIDGMEINDNNIYIGKGSCFSIDTVYPDHCCLISIGQLPENSCFANVPQIIIDEDTSEFGLYNKVQLIYEKLNSWSSVISNMILNDAEIQTILDYCRPYFPGTFFLVVDSNYHVIATTSEPSFVMDETGSTPADVVTRFKKDPEYRRTRLKKGTFFYDGKYFDHAILIHHIFINDVMSGTFSIAEHGMPITDGLWTLFNHLAELIDYCYQNRSYKMQREYVRPNATFNRLLQGEMLSEKQLSETVSNLGWKTDDTYKVCFVAIHEADKMIGSTLYLCRKFDASFVSAFSLEFHGDIVIILNHSRIIAADREADSKTAIAEFLNEHMLEAGASMEFHGLNMLRNYYLQAKAAYTIGIELSKKTVYHFSDIKVDYMIKNISSDIYPETLCPDELLKLRDIDKEKGSQYLQTLYVYFRTGMNASRTAKEMFINRSTLLERLGKIWRLLDIDPEDYESRLYLMICLEILRR